MAPIRVLSAEQFNELTTDQKYLYISEMLRHIVASRQRPNGQEPVGQHLERVAQRLTDADYARLPDIQKIRYLESLINELIGTVAEAQRTLRTLRAGSAAAAR